MTRKARKFLDKAETAMSNTNQPEARGFFCGVIITTLMFLFDSGEISTCEYKREYDLVYQVVEEQKVRKVE